MQPLQFYHFGGTDPGQPSDTNYNAGADKNFGVDERAEVGLISRNITLTADTPATGDSNHWGGELRFVKGYKEVSLQGVELQKFGKEQIASYPIHFHMDGSLPAELAELIADPLFTEAPLASPPIAAGVAAAARRGYVAQQHPEGRITFVTLDSGEARTLTGYELGARVVDWSQP